jgi:exodeoxyribonuclease V beta subunit
VLGFIDLLFRIGTRYYLLDWKSNWIPDDNYGATAITENMKLHHYDVQYRVYGCALHNWLARRIPAYNPEIHFGGVIYVYLRGTRPGQAFGIWATRPTPGELQTEWPLFVRDRLREISGATE